MIKRIIYKLSVTYIISIIFTFTIAQFLPISIKDINLRDECYYYLLIAFPFAILLTCFGTVKNKNKKIKNGIIIIVTIGLSIFSFVSIFPIYFIILSTWSNDTVLYKNKYKSNVTIVEQIWDDMEPLKEREHRVVELRSFLKYFQIAQKIDTTKMDKSQWIAAGTKK
jgi:hypothetical protein